MKMKPEQMLQRSGEAEQFLKLFANQSRLMVLCNLIDGELTVGALNERVPISQSSLSQHLQLLRDARLVTARKEAREVYYRITDPRAMALLESLYDAFCHE
ncbi:MAG: helix-turn-helix transcriptional regulator [Halieaceae bacterium]|nr:helix-turn-helix transcriptional regulator [Halieaceae bacterium]